MAYNHGKEERKWRIWKEAEEKTMRECGVDESVIEKIHIYDRVDFNSTRRFYTHLQEVGTYLEDIAVNEQHLEVNTITDLLDEIENENLYRALLTVDKCTLQIVLLKMQGYSTKEIAPLVGLTTGAVYARLDHLRKKLRKILCRWLSLPGSRWRPERRRPPMQRSGRRFHRSPPRSGLPPRLSQYRPHPASASRSGTPSRPPPRHHPRTA